MDACRNIYRYVYVHGLVYTHSFCQLIGPGSNDIPVEISTISTQILVSITFTYIKEAGPHGEMDDYGTGPGNIHRGPGTSCCTRNKRMLNNNSKHTIGIRQKLTERFWNGQSFIHFEQQYTYSCTGILLKA